jgi:hypothetical protein
MVFGHVEDETIAGQVIGPFHHFILLPERVPFVKNGYVFAQEPIMNETHPLANEEGIYYSSQFYLAKFIKQNSDTNEV